MVALPVEVLVVECDLWVMVLRVEEWDVVFEVRVESVVGELVGFVEGDVVDGVVDVVAVLLRV